MAGYIKAVIGPYRHLWCPKSPGLETPDICYALLPAYQGHGYAQEIVSATLQFAKESLQIPVISAIVQPDNLRSIALLRTNGFMSIKLFSFPDKTEVLELYQKSSSQYHDNGS